MEKRQLGKTGEKLSIIGFGGIIVSKEEQKDANTFVDEAIDKGINYFDVAPSYGDAEDKLGPALQGKRNGVFLACKTEKRSKEESRQHLETSLRKLKTDHFDLYQFHGVSKMEEVEQIFGPSGAMETFIKAKESGLIRYIGFSAHSEEAALAMMDYFDFDSVLFPINWVNIYSGDFGPSVIRKAQEKGMGILALKAMAMTKHNEAEGKKYPKAWYEPVDDQETASLVLRYTLSQPVAAAIPPGDIRLFRWALKTAETFSPVTTQEEEYLKNRAKGMEPLFQKQKS